MPDSASTRQSTSPRQRQAAAARWAGGSGGSSARATVSISRLRAAASTHISVQPPRSNTHSPIVGATATATIVDNPQ